MEISIGDYVLSGGELAAAVLADALVRLVPGAIGDGESALTDSFQDGLLAPPVYTRPAEWQGQQGARHPAWRAPCRNRQVENGASLERTQRLRPDLLDEA